MVVLCPLAMIYPLRSPPHGLTVSHSPTLHGAGVGGAPGRIGPYETVDLKEDKIKEADKADSLPALPTEHEEEVLTCVNELLI